VQFNRIVFVIIVVVASGYMVTTQAWHKRKTTPFI